TLPVMVVSESLARRAWPGQDPLGQRVRVEAFDYGQAPIWWTIVGVVKNVRYRSIESPSFDVYVSAVQSTDTLNDIVIRIAASPSTLVPEIRDVIRRLNPGRPITIDTMDHVVASATAPWRANVLLLGAFAVLAIVFATTGVYSVIAYAVTERTRE